MTRRDACRTRTGPERAASISWDLRQRGAAGELRRGSGALQPDGKTVVFHIADGTAGKDWNTMDEPVRVKHGMTLHLIDDDTMKQHFLHTLGQPCTHGSRAIGNGYDCVIQQNAPSGMINGVYDHNGDGGRGRFYIEVVQ